MTEEERKRLAKKKRQAEFKAENNKFFNQYRKMVAGSGAGEKEMEMLTKSIPNMTQKKDTSEKGTLADFVAKMGGSVSEEELKRIKALLPKR